MPQEIVVPRLGWSMEEATLAAWHKASGDTVTAGEPLFALESDKATQDVEALDSGRLYLPANAPQAGDRVTVGQLLGYLLAAGEPPPDASPAPTNASLTTTTATASPAVKAPEISAAPATEAPGTRRTAISPRAARVARELGVDWTKLTGSGSTGRIRECDVRAAAGTQKTHPSSNPAWTPTRQTIAARLVASLRESAPVTLHTTADATRLVSRRNALKAAAGSEPAPTYNDLLLVALAAILPQHPTLNARWVDGVPMPSGEVHLGLAVDTDGGLLVPVVRNAHQLTLEALARQTRELVTRARARQLRPEELRGGTFTLTNLGAFGIDAFTPILNPPECAILGVGRIIRRPAVVGDEIVARDEVTLSLTFDHRALDGAPAARFLQALVARIENDR